MPFGTRKLTFSIVFTWFLHGITWICIDSPLLSVTPRALSRSFTEKIREGGRMRDALRRARHVPALLEAVPSEIFHRPGPPKLSASFVWGRLGSFGGRNEAWRGWFYK